MDLLLDTHAWIWWLLDAPSLSPTAKAAIKDEANEIFISAASCREITTKHRIGTRPSVSAIADRLEAAIAEDGFTALPISVRHAQAAGALPGLHRDPFDRMLIAQAMLENLVLVSNERLFEGYAVTRLW